MGNYRIFVEKKKGFQTEAISLYNDLVNNLLVDIKGLRLLNIYDIFNIQESILLKAKKTVFSEIVVDDVYDSIDLEGKKYLAVEFLDGQFDQRAYSAMQCLSLIGKTNATVRSGKLIIFDGDVSDSDYQKIKKYYINEIESKEKDLSILKEPEKINQEEVKEVSGFIDFTQNDLIEYRKKLGLAMSDADIMHVYNYFKNEEKRNPTETEIRMLDTYWSDHCRHTTFETMLDAVTFELDDFNQTIQETFNEYLEMRKKLKRSEKPVTLMDMACINSRYEKNNGNLDDLEISEEINACSVYIDVDVDGKIEKYLLMFKNETHNHPTEIEPFGGASTCIGGAIRDPLSGRSYVYQAMRVTGAGDITKPISETMEGKLPQRVISKGAASGYSSYGNQIGLATTYVKEIYHEGYTAKRMEVGAVVGAAPLDYVKRLKPVNGDVVILLGGRTGRDGIGGATGSSKAHSEKSLELCASEVQKGNAPEERKLQRLFRNPSVTTLIKRSNDFGAGGVSVAIGELADGLEINLDMVPTKYDGLNGTEIAISESQERMAVVVDKNDVFKFIALAQKENIETTVVAKVTDNNRLVMTYHGKKIVDISRDFINTNGVRQHVVANVTKHKRTDLFKNNYEGNLRDRLLSNLSDLNCSMNKGLVEMFDSTIGATTVLMPYGGLYQLTETQCSVQKIPLVKGNTKTCSIMSYGYDPYLTEMSPYHGSMYAVVDSIAKIISAGGSYQGIHFSFQEFFERLNLDSDKWGNVVEALLGTIRIQKEFGLAAIGGKDSMSGTFKDIHVPPTLISFAVNVGNTDFVISPELKNSGNKLYLIKHKPNLDLTPNVKMLKANYDFIHKEIKNQNIVSAYALGRGGLGVALCKMSYGNKLGFDISYDDLFDLDYGSIVVESSSNLKFENAIYLGTVTKSYLINGETFTFDELYNASTKVFKDIYPDTVESKDDIDMSICKKTFEDVKHENPKNEVNVFIPVFPGTNCDYDTAKAFNEAGGNSNIFVFRNTMENDVIESINEMAKHIDNSDILVISGGFSAGDEPDGSGKFIANVLNNEKVKNAINHLLERKGLILGICNGFQALVKSGLLPNGKLGELSVDSPTLAKNNINRHISKIVNTCVSSNKSPWLSSFKEGDIHSIAVSHGEGKFVVSKEEAKKLFDNGCVAFQYVDLDGNPTMDANYNPNGSYYAIEGIISPDGLILGKMGHSERKGDNVFKNITGNLSQDIFKNAINYFKKEN